MFFPKLRRRAKWVFLFLALMFAFSFVFFGVGAGGSGIGDYISDLFNRPVSSDTPALDDAQKAAIENPNDPGAQLELAQAAQAEGQTQVAISAYEKYRTMRPEDPDALRTLAALYGAQIAAAQQRAAVASGQAAEASLPKTLAPEDSQFLQELTTNPLTASLSAQAQARADAATADVRRLGFAQVAVFSKLTELVKDDPLIFLQYANAAEIAQDYQSAVGAYESYLDLQPNSPNAEQVQQRIDTLKAVSATQPEAASPSGSDDESDSP